MPKQTITPNQINLQVVISKEGDSFLATVPALDLTSFGDSVAEAQKNIVEAVTLFIEGCVEKGTLDDVLLECGWKKVQSHLEPPRIIASIDTPFAIPV